MMDQLTAGFTGQIRDALHIGNEAKLHSWQNAISNVMVSGLGGSGIGGAVVAQLVQDELPVPLIVNNDYHIPAFVNEETLFIVSSYSGNTEETLSAFQQARARHAEVACVTSGGKVLEAAQANNLNHIVIPGGNPPRSMLAYSLVQQFFVLNHYGLIGDGFKKDLSAAADLLDAEEENIRAEAKKVAEFLHGRLPVIYAEARLNGVATRFRQQINENSKMLCWHHVLPEMNHNELVGWAGGNENLAVVFLRTNQDYKRTELRMNISQRVIKKYTSNLMEIQSKGESRIEQALYHIHLEDWVSVYLAEMKEIDPVEVDVITVLKEELAKVNL